MKKNLFWMVALALAFSQNIMAQNPDSINLDDLDNLNLDLSSVLANPNPEWLLDAGYDDFKKVAKERFMVKKGDKWGMMDGDGKEILPITYYNPYGRSYHEGLIALSKGKDNYGVYDMDGKLVIAHGYGSIEMFSEGLAAVWGGGKWGYINTKGELVIKKSYDAAYSFHNGYAMVVMKTDKEVGYGFIDKTGNWVIDPDYTSAHTAYTNGYFSVKLDKEWGFVNNKDEMHDFGSEDCWYDEIISPFNEKGIATVKKKGKTYDVNTKCECVKNCD